MLKQAAKGDPKGGSPTSRGRGGVIRERLAEIVPGAASFLSREGRTTLIELSRRFQEPGPSPSEVLLMSARALTGRAFGLEAADGLIEHLSSGRPVLAAHHHGLDTHPEMVQGELVWGLSSILGRTGRPVCVLAAASVPLNNPTAPGGLLPGRRNHGGRRGQARLFSRSLDRAIVSRAPAITRKAATSLISRLPDLAGWTDRERGAARLFAERFLLDEKLLSFDRFTDQAAYAAAKAFSARLGAPGGPPLIILELEALATSCLVSDLADKHSPASLALLHGPTRSAIISELAGKRGAWSAELVSGGSAPSTEGSGTAFFWAVSKDGRKRALGLGSKAGRAVLTGTGFELPLAPEPLATALAEGLLIPGLFLDYLALASHGLSVHGGIFMIHYLSALLEPAARILGGPLGAFGQKGPQRGHMLGAGLLPFGFKEPFAPGGHAAAGALEIMSPLGEDFLKSASGLSVSEVGWFSAGEWYQEETPASLRIEGWENELGVPAALVQAR
jgi:hypothetical protein